MRQLLSLILGFSAGCGVALEVPGDADVVCETTGDCPLGWQCDAVSKRCFLLGGEREPPRIVEGSFSVSRERVGLNIEVTVSFETTEEVADGPNVSWVWDSDEPPELVRQGGTGTSFSFAYTATGREPPGRTDLRIEMRDAVGNRGRATLPQVVVFDFESPAVDAPQVTLIPDGDNVLAEIGALRDGGRARVIFYTSEPLEGAPIVSSTCGAAFSRQAGELGTTFFTYFADITTSEPEGPCAISADITDVAGNSPQDPAALGTLTIDTIPPPVSAVDQGRLLHLRVPWGAQRNEYDPAQYLVAASQAPGDALSGECGATWPCIEQAAFEYAGETIVRVRVFDREVDGGQLGVVEPATSGSGWQPKRLSTVDSAEVWLELVDHAGNLSDRVRVQSVQWIATLGNKLAYDTFANPHELVEVAAFQDSIIQPTTTSELDILQGVDRLGSAHTTVGKTSWFWARTSRVPPRRIRPGLAFDQRRGKIVLFGGKSPACEVRGTIHDSCAETWEWDGLQWELLAIPDPEGDGNPPGDPAPLMAYDPIRGRTVLLVSSGSDGRTWEWDGTSWRNACAGGCGSEPVAHHPGTLVPVSAMAYDPLTEKTLLVRGSGTYQWDGSTWSVACWPSTCTDHPSETGGPNGDGQGIAMAFDRGRGRMVAVGSTTWEWDGSDWLEPTIVDTDGLEPSQRTGTIVAYDAVGARILLYGGSRTTGICDDGAYLEQCWRTWEFTGTEWRPVDATWSGGINPGTVAGAGATEDRLRDEIFVFGGSGYPDCPAADWICDGSWVWDCTGSART